MLYEGTPDFPDKERWWSIVERYGVTILYTAPTAIRAHMKWGPEHAAAHDLARCACSARSASRSTPRRGCGTTSTSAAERCPIVDTWWQTETGMILITPLPGVTTTKPGSATKPFPGVEAAVVNEQGERVEQGGGYLVLERPWPAMTRGIFGDDERFRATYWERFPGLYFAGDGARIDEDGDFWLLGRVDDVMNVSGHRISTIEVESALVDHPRVAEAAVCGRSDATTGQAIVAYVTLKGGDEGSVEMLEELRNHVAHEDRRDREAREHRLHARAAEDALGQDHAPPPPRRGREPAARRHDDARRPVGRVRARGARRGGARRGLSARCRLQLAPRLSPTAAAKAATVRSTSAVGRPPARDREPDRGAPVPGRPAHPRLAALPAPPRAPLRRRRVVREAEEHLVEDDVVEHLAARELGDALGERAARGAAALDQLGDARRGRARGSPRRPARRARAARTPGV